MKRFELLSVRRLARPRSRADSAGPWRIAIRCLALMLLVAGCAKAGGEGRSASPSTPSTVILISLDGTRPADLENGLPSLVALGRRGLRAEALVPVDPTNTFPNHVSLATGVRPEVHRLVNNGFVDPERGRYTQGDPPHEWIEAEPIWSIAERGGVPAASFYWVGSEGPTKNGLAPRETRAFSSRTLERTKVDQILAWLAIDDPEKRPRLITAWFHGADHAAHVEGPNAPSVAESLAPQDREIARLVEALDAEGRFASTTLIFVSDHGMARAAQRINLGSLLRKHGARAKVIGIGGFASIYAGPTRRDTRSLDRLVEIVRGAGLEAHRRSLAPVDWHVGDVRFGDVVVRAPIGTAIVTPTSRIEGFHGYAASEPSMAGILVAYGRGVQAGSRLGRVSSLSIAPSVLTLLGLPVPAAMEAPVLSELTRIGSRADAPRGRSGKRNEREAAQ
ncbi:MAG: ectonucleotide pyrophosphatase/phosphodiesterase [Myxococcota bacterium]